MSDDAIRQAEAYAKTEIEKLVGGPIMYCDNGPYSAWGTEFIEAGDTSPNRYHCHSPMEAAYRLINYFKHHELKGALEWRRPPEIEQNGDIILSYMRFAVKPKDKAA